MKAEIKLWLDLAYDDLDTARQNFNIKKYHIASLFAQQAVEKALKALYMTVFHDLKKTHDLVFLANKLDLPDSFKSICKKLDPIYLQTRYPDVSGQLPRTLFNVIDAQEFINISDEVVEWVKKKIL